MKQTLRQKIDWRMLPLIWTLAWPTMLEQLMQTAVQYIDLAMVGSLGTAATAAVGSTTTINWLLGSSLAALSIGFLAYISQAIGAGNWDKARRAVGQSVLMVLLSGSLFTVLTLVLARYVPTWMQVEEPIRPLAAQYFFILYTPMLLRTATIIFSTVLRAAGDTKTPMLVGVLVNIINVVLNFLLIYPTRVLTLWGWSFTVYGAGQGVVGAAIASAVSIAVGGICITWALYRHPQLAPKGVKLRLDWQVLEPCLHVALPNMLQRFGTSLGYVAFAAMINSLGDVATAAHTIANTVESLFYIPAYGMQTAAATLAGNALGAQDKRRLQDMSVMMLLIEVTLMLFSGGALFAVAPQMMDIFSDSMEVILLGAVVLRMVAVSEPFYGVSIIIEGMLLGMGNTKTPFRYNILGMWGVRIVGTFFCTQMWGMGLVSAWACMILHNLLLFILFGIYYLRGKWIPPQLRA